MKIKDFFKLKIKASTEVDEEAKAELEVKDPSSERAKAILKEADNVDRETG